MFAQQLAHSSRRQVLLVTAGEGIYQVEGETARKIAPGDAVWVPAGVNHWHGATNETAMAHYAVTLKDKDGNLVTRGRPVTDEEFATANDEIKA